MAWIPGTSCSVLFIYLFFKAVCDAGLRDKENILGDSSDSYWKWRYVPILAACCKQIFCNVSILVWNMTGNEIQILEPVQQCYLNVHTLEHTSQSTEYKPKDDGTWYNKFIWQYQRLSLLLLINVWISLFITSLVLYHHKSTGTVFCGVKVITNVKMDHPFTWMCSSRQMTTATYFRAIPALLLLLIRIFHLNPSHHGFFIDVYWESDACQSCLLPFFLKLCCGILPELY